MKKITALTAFILIFAMCLAACGKKPDAPTTAATTGAPAETQTTVPATGGDLVGNWKEDVFDSGFIFNADGTGTDTFWDLTFTYSIEGNEVLIIYDTDLYGASRYTYSVSGDTLSMTRIDEEETSTFNYQKSDMPETEAETAESEAGENETAEQN